MWTRWLKHLVSELKIHILQAHNKWTTGQLDTLLSFIYTCFMLNDISYSNTSDASYGQPQVIITLVQIGMLSTQMF